MILDWNKRDQNLGTGKVWLDGEALTGRTLRIEFADDTLLLAGVRTGVEPDKKPLS